MGVRSNAHRIISNVLNRDAGPVAFEVVEARAARQGDDAAEGVAGQAAEILLVEDNPDAREMLQAILELDGFQVVVAEDGQQDGPRAAVVAAQVVGDFAHEEIIQFFDFWTRKCRIRRRGDRAARSSGGEAVIDFRTEPSSYRHWRLEVEAPLAFLTLAVDPDGGLGDYELKQNSYDLGVDVELQDAVQRLRFEHPEVHTVVVRSGRERV